MELPMGYGNFGDIGLDLTVQVRSTLPASQTQDTNLGALHTFAH